MVVSMQATKDPSRSPVLLALGEERRAKAEFARAAELDPAFGDAEN